MTPEVDVVIAVHDPSRAIDRAAWSVLEGTQAAVRLTVVAHNTDPGAIAARLGSLADRADVRLLELHDGVASPAGPFNLGLDAATASFTSIMGSDDTLDPGAIDAWLAHARRTDADAVIARLRHASGSAVPTPVARPLPRALRDPVADRLSYRSAPLGLISRRHFGDLRLAPGLPVGEDVPYVTRVWFSGGRIAYAARGPAYRVHADADTRTTTTARPVAGELAFVPVLLDDEWFRALPGAARQAIVAKLVRVNLFGAVWNRRGTSDWAPQERADLAALGTRLLAAGDGIERVLSRLDRDLLDRILDAGSPGDALVAAADARRRFAHPRALLPRRLRDSLHREAPLRFAAASAWQLL